MRWDAFAPGDGPASIVFGPRLRPFYRIPESKTQLQKHSDCHARAASRPPPAVVRQGKILHGDGGLSGGCRAVCLKPVGRSRKFGQARSGQGQSRHRRCRQGQGSGKVAAHSRSDPIGHAMQRAREAPYPIPSGIRMRRSECWNASGGGLRQQRCSRPWCGPLWRGYLRRTLSDDPLHGPQRTFTGVDTQPEPLVVLPGL